MPLDVILLPEAEIDLLESELFYETERVGLGARFEDAVDKAITHAAANPGAGSLVPGTPEVLEIRRVIVDRFPYTVVYVRREETLFVVGVAADRKRPGFWMDRLRQVSGEGGA